MTRTAAAAEGFSFGEWRGDCSAGGWLRRDDDRRPERWGAPTPMVDVRVTVRGDGAVTSEPAGIDCKQACTASFAAGDALVLMASLGLRSWGGACAGTDPSLPCTLTRTPTRR